MCAHNELRRSADCDAMCWCILLRNEYLQEDKQERKNGRANLSTVGWKVAVSIYTFNFCIVITSSRYILMGIKSDK